MSYHRDMLSERHMKRTGLTAEDDYYELVYDKDSKEYEEDEFM
ncbi:MAG: hypothetical protein ACP5N3_03625 [Candidatus Nanoarchaeia archaeon]